jgi:Electron transfer DM13
MSRASFWSGFGARWKVLLPLAVVGTGVLAWLVFGVFAVHTLFIDDQVDEAPPVFAAGPEASVLAADSVPLLTEAEQPAPQPGIEAEPSEPTAPAEAVVVTLVDGAFMDRSHPTSGRAVVLNDGSEQRFLRFEEFATDNGPDLNVYLSSAAPDASVDELGSDFIDLGDLKGNVGPQNFEIPPDVDLDRYSTVVVWCVRFGVAFGAAGLAPPT